MTTSGTTWSRARGWGIKLKLISNANEQIEFIDSVERGWYELRSGLGEFVVENDNFFVSIRKEIRNKNFRLNDA